MRLEGVSPYMTTIIKMWRDDRIIDLNFDKTPTFLAINLDKIEIWELQLRNSLIVTPRNLTSCTLESVTLSIKISGRLNGTLLFLDLKII